MIHDVSSSLKDILKECEFVKRHTEWVTEPEFFNDEVLQYALIRAIGTIGEASKRIPDDYRKLHPEVDWKGMCGMRDKLIHDYNEIDVRVIWVTVQTDIPLLIPKLRNLLSIS